MKTRPKKEASGTVLWTGFVDPIQVSETKLNEFSELLEVILLL